MRNKRPDGIVDYTGPAGGWGALKAVKHATPHIRPGGSITLTSGVASSRPLPT